MDRAEKIKILEDFCDEWELCSDGCPIWDNGHSLCSCKWENMSEYALDKYIELIGAKNAKVQAVNSFYAYDQHENKDRAKATVTVSDDANNEWTDAHPINNPSDAKPEMVNHPSHYNQGGIECIDAMAAATVNKRGIEAVCVSNVIKYLWRYEAKNGLEDVRKAQFYINRLIDEMEAKSK